MVSCQKLKKRSDFQNLTHKSQAFKTPAFILLYAPYAEANIVRLGYTATKRSIGNAVSRNRAKRRLRALADKLIRLNTNFALPNTEGADFVLIARHKLAETPFEALEKDLHKALTQIGCAV